MNKLPSTTKITRRTRQAQIASVLAAAWRAGDIEAEDALRIIRHDLRRLQTNKKLEIPRRSRQAHKVIRKYALEKEQPPKNGSSDALHADHLHPVTTKHLKSLKTVQQWTRALSQLEEVVCVTAAENYRLEQIERAGITGLEKYAKAKIRFVDSRGRTLKP